MRALPRAATAVWLVVMLMACTARRPDQDRRILEASPVERLSAALLWQDFQSVREQAERAYVGRALIVAGDVTRAGTDEAGEAYVYFGQTPTGGVYAVLLDDQAEAIMAAVEQETRVQLKCFCEGLTTDVVLRSCIAAE